MGALPYDGGVACRVWAPHAVHVTVAGTFNNWSASRHPLAHEGGGYWSVDVDGAGIGDEYKFVIGSRFGTFWRKDPYGRDVDHSTGNASWSIPRLTGATTGSRCHRGTTS